MSNRKRRLAALTVGATLLGLVLSTTAASAQPATSNSGPTSYQITLDGLPASTQELLAEVAGSNLRATLTLITGDQVVVGLNHDGVPVVQDIVAAPRADGATPVFYTVTRHDQVYVLPSDALSLLGANVLDWELFNLAKLAAHVANGTVDQVPVIVTYRSAVAARLAPAEVPGATVERTFDSIDGAAVTIEADGAWWQEVQENVEQAPAPTAAALTMSGPLSGVEKVWLDELAQIQLDESVPQVGAPLAWAKDLDGTGVTVAVLDTGIDANHPDVAGKIIDAVDFTDSPSGVVDGHGHGTHVAATIAGTGAASNGLRPGVAPGADLLIGKVCNDGGSCPNSAILEGMEWAAVSGARVVNMSLGGGATDGTDPLSQAVNELTAQYGTLYVIAAGNSGPSSYTVSSPAAADAALAVAAVDKNDEMADFSSRGPRVGDDAAKPDIAAPGVGIVAARAAGTAMGTVVDDYYTSANGTSMATPHVAGGAAIIAQQHPDLSGPDIKALLMGTALDLGHDLYAQGTGLMDLGRAVDPSVFAGGSVNFGRLTYPHSPVTDQVRFINVTDEPITLSLTTEFTAGDGSPAPAGLFTVGADEVTVPAQGEATVDITVDGRVLEAGGIYGKYNGFVQAFDDEGTLRTRARVAVFLEPERFPVEVNVTGGDASTNYGNLLIVPMDDQTYLHDDPLTLPGEEQTTVGLYAGAYAIATSVTWSVDGVAQTGLLVAPEVTVDGPTTVTLDLADLEKVEVKLPKQTQTFAATLALNRVSATGAWGLTAELESTYAGGEPHWWVLPTGPVDQGTLTVDTYAVLVPVLTTLRAVGSGPPLTLDSRYVSPEATVPGGRQGWVVDVDPETGTQIINGRYIQLPVPRLTAKGTVPVVHAGTGTPEELAAAGVSGKLVLLTATDICTVSCAYDALHERVEAAADAGAVGVLVASAAGHVNLPLPVETDVDCATADDCPPVEPYSSIPVLSVPADQAAELVAKLDRPGAVRIQVGGNGAVTEVYGAEFHHDRVPSMPYRLEARDLVRTEHRIHDDHPGAVRIFNWGGYELINGVWEQGPGLNFPSVATPGTVVVYLPQASASTVNRFSLGTFDFVAPYLAAASEQELNSMMFMVPSESQWAEELEPGTYVWNTGPRVPGAHPVLTDNAGNQLPLGFCSGCREGDTFWPSIQLTGSTGHPTETMAGLVNDMGAGAFMLGVNGCNSCELALYDEAGQELPPTLIPMGMTIVLGDQSELTRVPAGAWPTGQLPLLVGGLGTGLIDKEATR
ncbi:MAG TPA: S8 family serine peptidase [Natronosporangium sp.]|nr:S8 family serine peptidase [Natronosporangium sp.]